MAFSSIIGALRVVLGVNTAQFDTGLKDSAKNLQTFGADVAKAGAAITAAFSVVGGAVASMVTKALGEAGKLAGLSQAVGMSVEQLSALKFAAQESGKSLDQLGDGLKTLNQRMVEAVADKRSDPARVFAALGISVKDASGQLRNAGDILLDVAAKFQTFQNGPAKVKLAEQLGLGDLIPLLNKGKDGIQGLMDEAARLGVVISTQTAVAAKQFNTDLEKLSATKDQLVLIVAARLAPALQQVSDRMLGWARDATQSSDATAILTGSFKTLVTAIEIAVAGISSLRVIFANFWESLKANEGAEAVIARNGKMWEELKTIWAAGSKSIAGVWNDWLPTVNRAADETGKAMAPIAESARGMKERLAEAHATLMTLVSAPTQNFAEKMVAIQQAMQAGLIPVAQQIMMTNQVLNQMREDARATLNDFVNAPLETFVDKMTKVRQALADGTINMREFGNTTKKINDENMSNWQALGSAVSSALTTIFKDSKAAAIAAAVINTAQAVTKNLATYPMPFGGIMAGLAIATGLAQIAAIKSTSISGGGGGGGTGSVPSVSAAATAPAADSAGGPAGSAGGNQTLTVNPLGMGDLFSGDAVRMLAERLLDFQRNGGTVVLQAR